MRYVIIGNSAAAVGCVEGIRQQDQKGEIVLISREPYHTYSRPLISYFLCGKTDEERMKYRPDHFYQQMGATALLGKTVVKVDPKKKMVILEDGEEISYGKLLVAAGSKPFVPEIPGLNRVERKFTFMSLEDAKALQAELSPKSRVLILGAGLIGLKCAEGIFERVACVQVVDLAERILPSILDEKGAALVQAEMERKGVTFFLSTSVSSFSEGKAVLTDGRELPFDLLVIAVGVRPNVELIRDAGGKVNRGIVTDALCRTSFEDVFAAGDCTESRDITTGENRILALLPNAYMQGECAGLTMAGKETPYDKAIPMNAVGFFGYHVITAGSYDGEEYVEENRENYKKLITKEGLLKGYILIGDIQRAGIYTSLIRERVPLEQIDFDLIKEKPQLMAFSKVERVKQLGGGR